MSKKGSPWENGYQESWSDNLKLINFLQFERLKQLENLLKPSTKQFSITTQKNSHKLKNATFIFDAHVFKFHRLETLCNERHT